MQPQLAAKPNSRATPVLKRKDVLYNFTMCKKENDRQINMLKSTIWLGLSWGLTAGGDSLSAPLGLAGF